MSEELANQEAEKIKAEAEQIAAYKAKYNVVRKIISDDGEHVLWLKEPSRLVVGIFMATVTENVVVACEYIFNDCVVQEISDVPYFQEKSVFYGIISELQRIISVKKSTCMTL